MSRRVSMALLAVLLLPVSWYAAACTPADPDRQFLLDVAQALGGQDRITALKSMAVEGEGDAPMLGQSTMPDSEQPNWKVTEYRRTTDFANDRTDMQQVRTVQFLFAGPGMQRQHQILDGTVAFDLGADGMARRAGAQQARDRRTEMLQHPIAAVRAALDEGTTLSNRRSEGDNDLIDVKTLKGDVLTLAASRVTHLPVSVTTRSSNDNLGDVAVVTTFADYEDVSGLKMPRTVTTRVDKYLQLDLKISRNAVDVDPVPPAPDAVKSAAVPEPPAITVAVEPVTKGVWWLAGSGNHRSIVVEFRPSAAVRGPAQRGALEGGDRCRARAQPQAVDPRGRHPPPLRSFGRSARGRRGRADHHHPARQRSLLQRPAGAAVDD